MTCKSVHRKNATKQNSKLKYLLRQNFTWIHKTNEYNMAFDVMVFRDIVLYCLII